MASDQYTSKEDPPPVSSPAKPSRRRWLWALGLFLLVAAGGTGFLALRSPSLNNDEISLHTVTRGPLTISMAVEGTAGNRDMVIVKCEVSGKPSIQKLIPEGWPCKEGQVLVELDASGLVDRKARQEITVSNAKAQYVQTREEQGIVESQAASDLAEAELNVTFAKQDLKKYLEGEYPQQLQQAEADITLAEAELERASDQLAWSEKLAKEKYLTRTELEADRLALKRRELDLELTRGKLKLLKEYTYTRQVDQLRSDIEQAEMSLNRTKGKSRANTIKSEADLTAKESAYTRETEELEKIIDQIAKCHILAPVAADMVIYATTGKRHEDPLEEGMGVREGQELIFLPTSRSMKVDLKVPETNLRKIQVGMPVRLTADALKGKTFFGRVEKIGLLPDAPNWFSSYRTVYSTEILLDQEVPGLRAGTTCQAEIIAEEYEDALSVPLQAVVRVKGEPFVQVLGANGKIEDRAIQIGLDNNAMIHVISGLRPGEKVLMDPALQASSPTELRKPDAPQTTKMPKPKSPAPTTMKRSSPKPTTTPTKKPSRPRGGGHHPPR